MIPEIISVKEIGRGVDWVKFLARWKPDVSFAFIHGMHNEWVKGNTSEFACGDAIVMPFNFSKSAAIFKFKTEPYSMKSNECYRYVDRFGKWMRAKSAESEAKMGPNISGELLPRIDSQSKIVKNSLKELFKSLDDVLVSKKLKVGDSELKSSILMNDSNGCYVYTPNNDNIKITQPNYKTVNNVRVKSLISRITSHNAV